MKPHAQDIDADTVAASAAGRRPTLTLDVALYESYLEDSGLSEEDRRALLEALWSVIVGFVDLGFAVEPAAGLADKSGGRCEELASAGSALVDYPAVSTTDHFEKAAAHTTSPGH